MMRRNRDLDEAIVMLPSVGEPDVQWAIPTALILFHDQLEELRKRRAVSKVIEGSPRRFDRHSA